MEQQELWPGAGMWLDFACIELQAIGLMGAVAAHLEPMTTHARVTWLERFLIEYPEIVSAAALSRADELIGMDETRIYIRANLIRSFEDSIRRRLEKEQSLSDLHASSEPVPPADVEDDPAQGKWTNEQAAVALYALLRAAGLPERHNKTAVARFAHLLTGRSQKRMGGAHLGATDASFNDQTAQAVADEFEQMGLAKVAADVRNRFGNAG